MIDKIKESCLYRAHNRFTFFILKIKNISSDYVSFRILSLSGRIYEHVSIYDTKEKKDLPTFFMSSHGHSIYDSFRFYVDEFTLVKLT